MSGPPPDERRGTTGSAVAATLTDGQLFSPDIFIAPRAPPEEAMLDDVLFFGVAAPPTPGGEGGGALARAASGHVGADTGSDEGDDHRDDNLLREVDDDDSDDSDDVGDDDVGDDDERVVLGADEAPTEHAADTTKAARRTRSERRPVICTVLTCLHSG